MKAVRTCNALPNARDIVRGKTAGDVTCQLSEGDKIAECRNLRARVTSTPQQSVVLHSPRTFITIILEGLEEEIIKLLRSLRVQDDAVRRHLPAGAFCDSACEAGLRQKGLQAYYQVIYSLIVLPNHSRVTSKNGASAWH